MNRTPTARRSFLPDRRRRPAFLALALLVACVPVLAQPEPVPASAPAAAAHAGGGSARDWKTSGASSDARQIGEQVREALRQGVDPKKQPVLTVQSGGRDDSLHPHARKAGGAAAAQRAAPAMRGSTPQTAHLPPGAIANPRDSRHAIRARAAALAGHPIAEEEAPEASSESPWSYAGERGPQAWGTLRPDFALCAKGQRQSPIDIQDASTLQGPAEPIVFRHAPSGGSVVDNGHTIQVDVEGDNAITVRGSEFKLLQFHFHHPAEERVNAQSFAMVAHLVHRNADGRLAVVAVLLQPGPANPVIDKVWTYLPLGTGDRVRLPAGILDLGQMLPKDQRYYQFLGSLTTPPCTEGVLWLVLKQPVTISPEQLRLFAQLFPNNARPVQPVNGRAVRNAR